MFTDDMSTDLLSKIADKINRKRRLELLRIYKNDAVFDYIKDIRRSGLFDKGKTTGVNMRKVASLPVEVDIFFTKVYGEDYYKNPDFFTKLHSEWRVVDSSSYGSENDFIRSVIKNISEQDESA